MYSNTTGITTTYFQTIPFWGVRERHYFICVHDPAWWWVKASNLGGLGGPVVRFHLFRVLYIHGPRLAISAWTSKTHTSCISRHSLKSCKEEPLAAFSVLSRCSVSSCPLPLTACFVSLFHFQILVASCSHKDSEILAQILDLIRLVVYHSRVLPTGG